MMQGAHSSVSTRRVITVPSTFRKCPHCPTIFLDHLQLTQHLSQQHSDQHQERQCPHCNEYFVTYEDHTACESCLHTLRHNVISTKETPASINLAESNALTTVECGHCHQNFKSQVLAELHCLSTGHDIERLIDGVKENTQLQMVKKVLSGPCPDTQGLSSSKSNLASADNCNTNPSNTHHKNSSISNNTRVQRRRKRHLIRRNQTTCEVCGDECGSASSLYVHLRATHPELFPFSCGVCDHRFSHEASAKEHERRHASGELQCPVCPLRFSCITHLHCHTRKNHPDFTSFPCQFCGVVTPTVEALHCHVKVHHGDHLGLPAAFTCEVCQEVFHTGKALAIHRFSRHSGTVECGICGAQVGRRYLNKHINAVHTKEKIHKCDQCDKDFYSRTSLTGHQKRQHGPRKHLCHLCGKGYVHNVELQRHLKAHRNQRDFKCDLCGRSFLKAVDLTYHRRSHTGERPHQCHLCPEAFIKPLDLRKHMLKHTTIKKVKRLKYSKKKIDELTSSVIEQEEETEGSTSTPSLNQVQPLSEELPGSQHLTQPIPGFSGSTGVASPQPQSDLQHLAPTDMQVQQLSVTDLDGSHLEGQLELSQVVDELSSGELLEMEPELLLEATHVHGSHQNVMEGGADVGEDKEEHERIESEVGHHSQSVQVIYVQFMDPSLSGSIPTNSDPSS